LRSPAGPCEDEGSPSRMHMGLRHDFDVDLGFDRD
jgi:hypothetical protein